MWIVLAVLSFLASQVYLFRCLQKLDGVLESADDRKEVLSVALADSVLEEQMAYLLETYSLAHPNVDLVLHIDPRVMEAVWERKADVGFCAPAAETEGLSCQILDFPGEPRQQMVWKNNKRAGEFVQFLRQACGK